MVKQAPLTPDNKAQYQLDKPVLRVLLQPAQNQPSQTLNVGKLNPAQTHRYAHKEPQSNWYLIGKNLDTYLDTQWSAWVENKWMRVSQDDMTRLTLRSQASLLRLHKPEGQWAFDQKQGPSLDANKLNQWMRRLNTSEATQWYFAEQEETAWRSQYGFDQPLLKVDIAYPEDHKRPSVTWQLAKDPTIKNRFYAKRDDQPWVVQLKPGDAQALLVEKQDWVDAALLFKPLSDHQNIAWTGIIQGQAKATDKGWQLQQPVQDALDTTHLESLFEALMMDEDKKLVAMDAPKPTAPGITLTFEAKDSAQTLHVYQQNGTDFVWRKEPSPLLVASDQALLSLIQGHLSKLRQAKLFSGSSETITGIAYKSPEGQWAITRHDQDAWQWTQATDNPPVQAYQAYAETTDIELQNLRSPATKPASTSHQLTFTQADGTTATWMWQPTDQEQWTLINTARNVQGILEAEKAQRWAKFLIKKTP
jgi:hypothetical protein